MISVVILTKNEEKNIVDCLESISWVDEIIVIDDYSEDRTLEVIKNLNLKEKIKVIKRRLNYDFSNQRNFGLSKTKFDWVFFLDADERVSRSLREEINSIIINKNKDYFGFYIPRKDVLWGKLLKHGETGDIKLLRLVKKGQGKWEGKVHETYMSKEKIGSLENYILHFPHQTTDEFLKEINFYTSIRAKELYDLGLKTNLFQVIFYPKTKFFVNFILKLGFLDGLEGFIFAIFMSFHSFLTRAKLLLLWQKS
ncbi:MAG TPA: glycosyltransferase family 2 protein [Candidatus Sulfotelmatobacter sp.]|nr:glycosyltransferase family 2 protein [Candidatus Sulfotelmatobacter sp.]